MSNVGGTTGTRKLTRAAQNIESGTRHDPALAALLALPFVDALLDALAERLKSRIETTDPIVFAEDRPCGLTPRAFHDRARRGDFPTFKVSRRTAARLSEVRAALEKTTAERPRSVAPASKAPSTPVSPDDRRLAQLRAVGALPATRAA